MSGALGYRLPPPNWKPAGFNPDAVKKPFITNRGPLYLALITQPHR